jgi:pseudaminic acid biosynthesis-associated methylase
MTSGFKTEQEQFWAGSFGDEYVDRNAGDIWVARNLALFSKIFHRTGRVESALELGANRGLNLAALRALLPEAQLTGIDINSKALELLKSVRGVEVMHKSILDFSPGGRKWEFVFTKTVLIHIQPESLPRAYDTMYECSSRFVCLVEYYNPTPVEVTYRGHQGKLFKRDFAGELAERHKDLRLVDYGFVYRRDPVFSQDDVNWFLFEKR